MTKEQDISDFVEVINRFVESGDIPRGRATALIKRIEHELEVAELELNREIAGLERAAPLIH